MLPREVCLPKCKLPPVYYKRFYIFFFYKVFHNNNLSSIIIIICFPVWPVHTLYWQSALLAEGFTVENVRLFHSCFSLNTAGAFYDSGIGACWEKYVLEMLGEMFLTSWRVREFEGDAFCATCTLQKDCREGHLSSFPGHRSSPHFGSFSSLKSCLCSPGLPHSCRSEHSPSGFLGKLF